MKKLYSSQLLVLASLLSTNLFSTPTIYTTNTGAGLNWSAAASWAAPGKPPATCNNCQIIIQGGVTLDEDIVLQNSELDILGDPSFVISLTVQNYVQLANTQVKVGTNATDPALLTVNNEIDFDATTFFTVANDVSEIDATNIFNNPVTGPNGSYAGAGLYYIIGAGNFDVTLSLPGMSNSLGNGIYFAEYDFNCNPAVPAAPNPCAGAIVYGPVVNELNGPHGINEFAQGILPVQLVQFVATRNSDHSVKVSWATAQEVNSAYFGVERSADAGSWLTLGNVPAKGFSSITNNYSYNDLYPLAGVNYYRLKMVDLDGKYKYSKVVSVSGAATTSESLVVYSNPFTDQIRLKINIPAPDNLTITVTDILGRSYVSQNYNAQAGDNFINLTPAGATPGLYFVHIQGLNYNKTVKLIKQ